MLQIKKFINKRNKSDNLSVRESAFLIIPSLSRALHYKKAIKFSLSVISTVEIKKYYNLYDNQNHFSTIINYYSFSLMDYDH